MSILNLKPEGVWKHFHALTQIPRPSKKEEKVRQFLCDYGKSLGFEAFADKTGNVIIRKPATPGMENKHGVILQAHMDMVPQKNNAVVHDFEKDPIKTRIEGDWVYATGTTLGADNGMGVAAAMAVLESKDLKHGPIEVLVTTDEETGMTGARGLEPGILQGDILLNMDSEDEGELYVGCAGGVDGSFEFEYTPQETPEGLQAFHLNLTGLKGGHSGMEISLGRGNANKVMARTLLALVEATGVRLAQWEGGNLRNAIPREADAVLCIPQADVEKARHIVADTLAMVRAELALTDPGLEMTLVPCEKPACVIPECITTKLIRAVYAAPNGVWAMSASMPELVETSSNLAIVKAKDGKIGVYCLIRSLADTAKEDMATALRCCFENAGGKASFSGSYPGWKPNMDSAILKEMTEIYTRMFGKAPQVKAIHAGLECGILGGAYPNWDMVSFGPTLRSPHSPDERCYIPSVQKFWDFLVETLLNIPEK